MLYETKTAKMNKFENLKILYFAQNLSKILMKNS